MSEIELPKISAEVRSVILFGDNNAVVLNAVMEYGKACAKAATERAAQIAESLHTLPRKRGWEALGTPTYSTESEDAYDETAERIAAAIRAEIEKEEGK